MSWFSRKKKQSRCEHEWGSYLFSRLREVCYRCYMLRDKTPEQLSAQDAPKKDGLDEGLPGVESRVMSTAEFKAFLARGGKASIGGCKLGK